MSAPKEMMKGNSSILILSCLAREPMHGYRITQELRRESDGYFSVGEGTLYPHLHQLEKDGLIEGYWETAPNGKERRCYRITEHGKAEFIRRREEWRRFGSNITRILDTVPELAMEN